MSDQATYHAKLEQAERQLAAVEEAEAPEHIIAFERKRVEQLRAVVSGSADENAVAAPTAEFLGQP